MEGIKTPHPIDAIVQRMREPKVKDMRAISHIKDTEEKEVKLICNLSGLSEEELGELSLKEYKALQGRLTDFL